jgi:LysR family hydrogen peroxide-inducible transcriptional activator
MDIKQLQALLAIADHGSFSAAAKALLTVQSNVSAHIQRLEGELGVTLVDRHDGSLTDEGEMVAQRARRVIHEIEDIDADIHSLGESASGEARIGAIGTTGRWLMPFRYQALITTSPSCSLKSLFLSHIQNMSSPNTRASHCTNLLSTPFFLHPAVRRFAESSIGRQQMTEWR